MLQYQLSNIIFIQDCLLLLKKIGFIAKKCIRKTQFLIYSVMYPPYIQLNKFCVKKL
ncbi:MAG: hypothetical protein JWP44_3415 [Mucilaginibacter sp.]|nr:hypothetical protein [Mucilaginibacter sp.]